MNSSSFESFCVSNAPELESLKRRGLVDKVPPPIILTPPDPETWTIADTLSFVQAHQDRLIQSVASNGAILFRGFCPDSSVSNFDALVRAFDDFKDLSYERSMSFAVRRKESARICTTNEGKSGGLVFHHEQAQTPLWPSHLFFCCQTPALPDDGGQTGLVSSSVVYEQLRQRFPDFVNQCETQGVRYTVYAGPTQDPTKGAGRSWKSFFHAHSKEECERKMRAGGWKWEWGVGPKGQSMESDFLKCTTPVLDAVKLVPGTTKKCFFNQLIATTANALEFSHVGVSGGGYNPLTDVPSQEGIDACVRLANGDSLPLDILLQAKQICEDYAWNIEWQRGDVALISNYAMMHARRLWNGPEGTRKLLASLVAEEHCTSFGKEMVAL